MNFRYENQKLKQGYTFVIGCDEVGRGCLAGPVVAAAVALPPQVESKKACPERSGAESNGWKVSAKGGSASGGIKSAGIRDSKLLSADKREYLSALIKDNCLAWGIGAVDEKTIDKINIHNATLLAMKRAVEKAIAFFGGVIPTECIRVEGSLHSPSDAFGLGRDDTLKAFLYIDGKFTIPGLNMEQEAVIDGDNKILSIAAASIIAKVYRDDLMRKLHLKYPIYNFAQHKGYGTLYHRTMILQNGLSKVHRKSFCRAFFPSLDGRG